MNTIRTIVFTVAASIIGVAHAAQAPVAIAPQGETLVTAGAAGLKVRVTIKTHEVQIGRPGDGRPAVIETNCTYSKYPCSIVDRIQIAVNGVALFIPRSVFADLADLNTAQIVTGKKGATLRLIGGDGSEGYVVKVEFDLTRVKHRVLTSGTEQDQPLQETTYHEVVVGN